MKYLLPCLLLLTGAAQAQVTYRLGPKVGGNLSTIDAQEGPAFQYRPGFEVGALGSIQLGHFALQPGVLYSQQTYALHMVSRAWDTDPFAYEATGSYRRGYLSFPLQLVYSHRVNGQGWQVLAGPYLNLLVNGHYSTHTQMLQAPATYDREGAIVAGDYAPKDSPDMYSQRVDAGAQAGIGYCQGSWLVQATYSAGLRDVSPTYYSPTSTWNNPYYNRSFQLSLAYLVSLKR